MKAGRELDKALHERIYGIELMDTVCENLAWMDEPDTGAPGGRGDCG